MKEGRKWIHNQTKHDLTITLLIREGSSPEGIGGTEQVWVPGGATEEVIYLGNPGGEGYVFLNGLLVEWEDGSDYAGVSRRVKQRGDAWDSTLNTNNSITISSVGAGTLSASGSNR